MEIQSSPSCFDITTTKGGGRVKGCSKMNGMDVPCNRTHHQSITQSRNDGSSDVCGLTVYTFG